MWFYIVYIYVYIYINKNKNYKFIKNLQNYKIYKNVTKNLYEILKHHKTNLIKISHQDGISLGYPT